MYFEENACYHIINRSNETVFYSHSNYIYFLNKVNRLILPYVDILAWCLMPNHFHFLIVAKAEGCKYIEEKHRPNVQVLSKNIGTLLSSYSRAINKEQSRRGKLFSHNTKAICLNETNTNKESIYNCFHYIHQNPLKANLVHEIKDWEYSSYLDFAGLRNGKLVNIKLVFELTNLDSDNFKFLSQGLMDEEKLQGFI